MMHTFLPFIFLVSVNLSLIQAHYERYNGARNGQLYPAPYNQRSNYQSPQKPVTKFDTPYQDSNQGHQDESEISSVGNGRNKQNVVILNENENRAYLQPNNINQRPKYGSNIISVSNVGNRFSNGNSVVIQNSAGGSGETIIHTDDNSYVNYNNIGRGPNNRNIVVINGKVYSNQGATVITRNEDGYIRSETNLDTPYQDSNKGHHDESEIFSVGNGHNRKNVVILNEGSRRNFQESEDRAVLQPRYGFSNTNQRPKYGLRVNNIGNGFGNRNSVVIQDSTGGSGETIIHTDDYSNVNYNNIGRGPNNRNEIVINGIVYSNPGTTVIRRKDDGYIRSEVISDNRYHRYPNEGDLKVLHKNVPKN